MPAPVTTPDEPDAADPAGSAELMMMLLADARLPVGAHTQSAGLEPALRAGMSMAELPGYLTARLRTVTAVEAGAAVVARAGLVDDRGPHAGSDGSTFLTERLAAVDAAWRARTVSPALREVSATLGRGYLRLIRRIWPGDPGVVAVAGLHRPSRAVVLGAAAAAAQLSSAQLIRLIGYEDVQTVSAAALKLEPTDPVLATLWVVRAGPEIERMVGALAELREVAEIPARSAPLLEQWAEIHALSTQRLFRA